MVSVALYDSLNVLYILPWTFTIIMHFIFESPKAIVNASKCIKDNLPETQWNLTFNICSWQYTWSIFKYELFIIKKKKWIIPLWIYSYIDRYDLGKFFLYLTTESNDWVFIYVVCWKKAMDNIIIVFKQHKQLLKWLWTYDKLAIVNNLLTMMLELWNIKDDVCGWTT